MLKGYAWEGVIYRWWCFFRIGEVIINKKRWISHLVTVLLCLLAKTGWFGSRFFFNRFKTWPSYLIDLGHILRLAIHMLPRLSNLSRTNPTLFVLSTPRFHTKKMGSSPSANTVLSCNTLYFCRHFIFFIHKFWIWNFI